MTAVVCLTSQVVNDSNIVFNIASGKWLVLCLMWQAVCDSSITFSLAGFAWQQYCVLTGQAVHHYMTAALCVTSLVAVYENSTVHDWKSPCDNSIVYGLYLG